MGCKQDLGERCEQGSDCSSGYCDHNVGGMVSAMGKVCTGPTDDTPMPDAASTADAQGNPSDVATSDAAGEAAVSGDAPDGQGDTGTSDGHGDTATSDGHGDTGASDATPEAGSGG